MMINTKLLPVKAHWFFFMAASGPILPFLTVYGKQLGISEVVMGSVTAVLPLFFLVAKPFFGFLLDYFQKQRRYLFMILIAAMSTFYVLLYFVPPVSNDGLLYTKFNDSAMQAAGCNCSIYTTQENNETRNTTEELSDAEDTENIYKSVSFYGFIIIMSLSMIGYNVSNSISDAICFDVLGPGQEHKYGSQRVWGAVGFGLTALLGGLGMDYLSHNGVKNYGPAFILVIVFTFIDLLFCMKLKLPKMTQSAHILKDVRWVLQQRKVVIFLFFTMVAGMLESYIIYFMFWFLEDVSKTTGDSSQIKILEGLIVAGETLGGEVIFFPLSGKILQKLGHGHTFTLCFFTYAIRLGLISLIPSPWWLLPIEFCMQGPTFALCYTTIVAYASELSPPGTSATMQGLVAGVDDGIGFALGSLLGGFLYKGVGGRTGFRVFSAIAITFCLLHAIFYRFILSRPPKEQGEGPTIIYKLPEEAVKTTDTPVDIER